MSTPHGKRGFFFHAWNDTVEEWERERVTAYEVPRISPAFLESERNTIGDFWFRQEYLCEFVDTQDQLFSSESIAAAIEPTLHALPLVLSRGIAPTWATPAAPAPVAPPEDADAADVLAQEVTGYVIGVDLGQARDYSVACVIERIEIKRVVVNVNPWEKAVRSPWAPPPSSSRTKIDVLSRIVFLQRFQLGTPYPEVARDLVSLTEQLPLMFEPAQLWVDATGVGRSAIDTMVDAGLSPVGTTITGGVDYTVHGPQDVRVPKRQLVGLVQVALQTGRLKIASDVPALRTWGRA